MKTNALMVATAMFFVAFVCPSAAHADASILNDTFFGVGGPPSDYAYNNGMPGNWSVAPYDSGFEYTYNGEPFTINLIPSATNINVDFFSYFLLGSNKIYDASSSIFLTMTLSDGINTIPVGGGTFLNSSYVQTDRYGIISGWNIIELIGADRTFTLGDLCCTTGDPPVFLTAQSFYPPAPEPSTWAMMLAGFAGLGLAGYRRAKARLPNSRARSSLGASVGTGKLLVQSDPHIIRLKRG